MGMHNPHETSNIADEASSWISGLCGNDGNVKRKMEMETRKVPPSYKGHMEFNKLENGASTIVIMVEYFIFLFSLCFDKCWSFLKVTALLIFSLKLINHADDLWHLQTRQKMHSLAQLWIGNGTQHKLSEPCNPCSNVATFIIYHPTRLV